MHPLTRPSSPLRRNLSIALAYMALGGLGLAFAIGKGYASPIFPASGLALAVALCFGNGVLPGIWLGSALLNLSLAGLNGTLSPVTVAAALLIATWVILKGCNNRLSVVQSRGVLALTAALCLFASWQRVASGGHFLSDVVLSWALTGLIAAILARILLRPAPAGTGS